MYRLLISGKRWGETFLISSAEQSDSVKRGILVSSTRTARGTLPGSKWTRKVKEKRLVVDKHAACIYVTRKKN